MVRRVVHAARASATAVGRTQDAAPVQLPEPPTGSSPLAMLNATAGAPVKQEAVQEVKLEVKLEAMQETKQETLQEATMPEVKHEVAQEIKQEVKREEGQTTVRRSGRVAAARAAAAASTAAAAVAAAAAAVAAAAAAPPAQQATGPVVTKALPGRRLTAGKARASAAVGAKPGGVPVAKAIAAGGVVLPAAPPGAPSAAPSAAPPAAPPAPPNVAQLTNEVNRLLTQNFLTRDSSITLSRAYTLFRLTRRELDAIPYDAVKNPHYSSGPPMRLYNVGDLADACIAKYTAKGTTLAQAKAKRVLATQRRENTIEQRRALRTVELTQALAARHLELRFDSRLCDNYINNTADALSLEAVVNRMEQMHILHVHTPYAAVVDEVRNQADGFLDLRGLRDDVESICLMAFCDYVAAGGSAVETAVVCSCGRPIPASRLNVTVPSWEDYCEYTWEERDRFRSFDRYGGRGPRFW